MTSKNAGSGWRRVVSRINRRGTDKRTYHICYKHPEHGSDQLGVDFLSDVAAYQTIQAIQDDPTRVGYAEWLRDASLWVQDNKGNIC